VTFLRIARKKPHMIFCYERADSGVLGTAQNPDPKHQTNDFPGFRKIESNEGTDGYGPRVVSLARPGSSGCLAKYEHAWAVGNGWPVIDEAAWWLQRNLWLQRLLEAFCGAWKYSVDGKEGFSLSPKS